MFIRKVGSQNKYVGTHGIRLRNAELDYWIFLMQFYNKMLYLIVILNFNVTRLK